MNTAQSRNKIKILLVGAGKMAQDYFQVLKDLEVDVTVFCRSKESANNFKNRTRFDALYGNLEDFVRSKSFDKAIVAVDIENLYLVSEIAVNANIKEILVEKPGGSDGNEISNLAELALVKDTRIFVGYNRRFYSSTLKTKEIIKEDGGVLSFSFEFTEWATKIGDLGYSKRIYENWFINNSSHVVDMAFYLCGCPKELHAQVSGQGLVSWHPSASIFYGSGKTFDDTPFNYKANWAGQGRWGVEVITRKRKLILQPLEELKFIKVNELDTHEFQLEGTLDDKYKPGLYLQTEAFLDSSYENLCSIEEQNESLRFLNSIAGYV